VNKGGTAKPVFSSFEMKRLFYLYKGVAIMLYEPKSIEPKRNEYWLKEKVFETGKDKSKKPYSIVIPPPNVTGNLHIGHALNNTIQDVLIRMKRMQGFDALWLPGMDHAGIATQARVEGKLREEGITRHDLGREKFIEEVWKWKKEYADNIADQWDKLGLSLDYSKERFTLDEGLSDAVKEVFIRLYEKGLIYRGKYIINWDPVAKTALSDIEVIHHEVNGKLYHVRYPLSDGAGYIQVATTRPETLLGDSAVAVHPDDNRYQNLIGKTVTLPFTNRQIPIIADEYVDQTFGSGAVKMTPAHDPNDFEVGLRHNLEQITVIDESGTMNELAGKFQGLDRFECRKQIIKDLDEMDLLVRVEDHVHSVGHSERSGAVVEPYLSTQWFVKMKPLADAAIALQEKEEKVQFVPDRFEKTYLNWIGNIRDWCISRQLWWGHRIPAWYCDDCGEIVVAKETPSTCPSCGHHALTQDNDVLDTWFSSALWPFSTMGWPANTEDLQRYYPTNVLVTGFDIIYFWVARMIFTALEFTGEKPFQDVLIHGLVRDSEGRKMSKSLDNGVNPMDVIEEYGADALRFMLATGTSPGKDLRFHYERVEAARNFANKVWNASRFALMHLEEEDPATLQISENLSVADKWILNRLNETVSQVTRLLEHYEFGEAGKQLYHFIWDNFCDWYIELAKLPLYGEDKASKKATKAVLHHVLDQSLKMLHPFMPFITEEIWQQLPSSKGSIALSSWPENNGNVNDTVDKQMTYLMETIRAIRNVRAEMDVPPKQKIELLVKVEAEVKDTFRQSQAMIHRLGGVDKLIIATTLDRPEKAMTAVVDKAELFFPLSGLVDVEQTMKKLTAEYNKLQKEVERVEKKLSNPGFVSKAPAEVIEQERQKGEAYKEKRAKVEARIAELQA
jgi:valyl-tRNA synthetase